MEHKVELRKIEHVNHNVVRLITDKPKDYNFKPGQATEMSIDKKGWSEKKRPFTFTSLPDEDELEFTIKIYPSHDGVTEQIEKLQVGNHLLIGDPWGAITYQGEGAFIAGGAGITPFIAILKDLNKRGELNHNTLFFSNHKEKDIIYKNNLEAWLGDHLHLTLSKEDHKDYHNGKIDKKFLKSKNLELTKPVYLCGPPAMQEAIKASLFEMGLPKSLLVTEE
ncbi:MAG: FAD-binding oxidoreductase [Psychroserpens sp.]|uniref:FAD-binding oxidoreductase n=1 Tax=Psychroserpens sp. TaxID=2020870 RepID=UPI003C75752C